MANILIVGKCDALAQKLKNPENKVFTTHYLDNDSEIEVIDIRDDDLTGLLKFVLDNEITLTIPVCANALLSDIVTFFAENGQNIFGPSAQAAVTFLNRIYEKKFLYRLHSNYPKFGVFSRAQEVKEYLKDATFPVVISAPDYNSDSQICTTMASAQKFLDNLYIKGETDILIEEYIFGKSFTAYYITDGYGVLPLATTACENINTNGEEIKNFTCIVPNYRITPIIEKNLNQMANDIINCLEHKGSPYLGIFGISGKIISENEFIAENIKTFLSDYDAQAVLQTCDDDLYKIFNSCTEGLFADEYTEIKTNELHCVSKMNSDGKILTRAAATISQAKKYLEEDYD